MTPTKRTKSLALALFICIAAPAVILPRRAGLLGRSTFVCDARGWNFAAGAGYTWISNGELIYFRLSPASDCGDLVRRNVLAHTDTDLIVLTRLWNHAAASRVQAEVSPDHRWLLSTDGDNPLASTIDGERSFTWKRGGDVHWLSDNRRVAVIDVSIDAETVIGASVRTVGAADNVTLLVRSVAFPLGSTVRISADDHLLTTGYLAEFRQGSDVSIYDVDLLGTGRVRRFVRRFPKSKVIQAAFSGDGRHIAWLTESANDSAIYAAIHKCIHALGFSYDRTVLMRLCVSRTDGTRMVDLGDVYCVPGYVKSVSWMPDGKHISFIYGNDLFKTVALR